MELLDPDSADVELLDPEASDGDAQAAGPSQHPSDGQWAKRLTSSGPWGELAEKWIPEPMRGARVDPGRRGALLLSVVAAIAAVVAAVGVWWTKPEPVPVPQSAAGAAFTAATAAPVESIVTAEPDADGAAGPGVGGAAGQTPSQGAVPAGADGASLGIDASLASAGPILVSVTGDVRNPGLVTVPGNARVADAIAAAGGALDQAQLTGLNLAAHLSDGSSVVVGGIGTSTVEAEASGPAPAGSDSGSAADGAPININTADAATLDALPGVGPVTAAAIIAYRTDHGPFVEVAQLEEVSGIGPATFARLAPHVTV